jgi:hypothetical protein
LRFHESPIQLQNFVDKLNKLLSSVGLCYRISETDGNNNPIYRIDAIPMSYDYPSISKNGIPILVEKEPSGYSHKVKSHKRPTSFPSLVLVFDSGWNDNNMYTQFDVYYYETERPTYIGKTKILIESSRIQRDDNNDTFAIIYYVKDTFYELPEGFCSLGQDEYYYTHIRDAIKDTDKTKSLLWALKDASMFPVLQELYEHEPLWSSLTRTFSADSMLIQGKSIILNHTGSRKLHFSYLFKPKYCDEYSTIAFDFNNRGCFPRRIFALIGKNGCGKTQLLSSIPQDIKFKIRKRLMGRSLHLIRL